MSTRFFAGCRLQIDAGHEEGSQECTLPKSSGCSVIPRQNLCLLISCTRSRTVHVKPTRSFARAAFSAALLESHGKPNGNCADLIGAGPRLLDQVARECVLQGGVMKTAAAVSTNCRQSCCTSGLAQSCLASRRMSISTTSTVKPRSGPSCLSHSLMSPRRSAPANIYTTLKTSEEKGALGVSLASSNGSTSPADPDGGSTGPVGSELQGLQPALEAFPSCHMGGLGASVVGSLHAAMGWAPRQRAQM
jgi:hypothetical protein